MTTTLLAALLTLVSSQTAPAEPDDHPGTASTAAPLALTQREKFTGDWGGAREKLEEAGISLEFNLVQGFQQVFHGGSNTHNAGTWMGTGETELTIDLGAMKLIPGGTIYTLANSTWNDSPTGKGWVPSLFDVNHHAGGDRACDVLELWYEQSLLDEKIRIKAGKLSLTTDFDTNAYANNPAEQFMNGGLVGNHSIPMEGAADGAIGLQMVVTPTDWLYFAAAVADAQADGRETGLNTAFHDEDYFLSIYEFGVTPVFKTPRGPLAGSYRFGLWYDPQPKERFFDDLGGRIEEGPVSRDDTGWYTSCDQLVWKEVSNNDGDTQGLGLFFRYGFAHDSTSELHTFWSAGGQYQGLLPDRDNDVLGIGVAQGILSPKMEREEISPHRETAIEVYYRDEIFPWLFVSPDLQWILDPGGGKSSSDAFVAGLRVQINF